MARRELKPVNYVAYGLNDILGAGSMAVISGWILFFYTTFCGLSAVQAASIFAIARILDAVASPLIGHISDGLGNTRLGRRFGRRRVFLIFSIPLLPSFALMWVSGQHYLYYLVTYVFFELVYAAVIIPYETLAAEMTDDYKKKAKLAGARILTGQVSAILAGILPSWIVSAVGGKESASTFLIMGVIFSVLFMVVVFTVWLFTWERDVKEVGEQELTKGKGWTVSGTLKALYTNLTSTMKIRAFRLHLGMYLGGYISQDVFNAVFTYFVVFAIGGSVVIASEMMAVTYVAQLFAVAVAIPMVMKFGPAPSYRVAILLYIIAIVSLVTMYITTDNFNFMWLMLGVIVAGLGRGALNYIPWNTYNYMADVDQIVTARRREGSFAGVMTFIRKATQAIAVMSVGIILEAGGFISGAETQSNQAISTIVLMLAIGPVVVLIFGFWVSTKFKLSKETHEVLMNEIEHLKRGATTPTSEENKAIVEDLSGFAFRDLWGNNTVGIAQDNGSSPGSRHENANV
ncbi:MFS transporter [Alteromonas sp. 1_MG-2023]|uniref:MFS transporter n=1 Tax=Alteromonas sp. 1_MG-2023 TaxID=3062669 RepID=UPI0026E28F11|nr:MFS transporter [Alteromonas sp. 1_MG-2023]MDO6473844.1 MFS transporter [Alteromonas sp. 1_MG-2023]